MAALGISLEEGFARFAELGDIFEGILKDASQETRADQLKSFINAFSNLGWSGQVSSSSIDDAFSRITEGSKVIALVTINPGEGGIVSDTGTTNHWVEIQEIDYANKEVTYYNPYTNALETVGFTKFDEAWKKGSGANTHTAVIAERALTG
jgi:hypothetical protein